MSVGLSYDAKHHAELARKKISVAIYSDYEKDWPEADLKALIKSEPQNVTKFEFKIEISTKTAELFEIAETEERETQIGDALTVSEPPMITTTEDQNLDSVPSKLNTNAELDSRQIVGGSDQTLAKEEPEHSGSEPTAQELPPPSPLNIDSVAGDIDQHKPLDPVIITANPTQNPETILQEPKPELEADEPSITKPQVARVSAHEPTEIQTTAPTTAEPPTNPTPLITAPPEVAASPAPTPQTRPSTHTQPLERPTALLSPAGPTHARPLATTTTTAATPTDSSRLSSIDEQQGLRLGYLQAELQRLRTEVASARTDVLRQTERAADRRGVSRGRQTAADRAAVGAALVAVLLVAAGWLLGFGLARGL